MKNVNTPVSGSAPSGLSPAARNADICTVFLPHAKQRRNDRYAEFIPAAVEALGVQTKHEELTCRAVMPKAHHVRAARDRWRARSDRGWRNRRRCTPRARSRCGSEMQPGRDVRLVFDSRACGKQKEAKAVASDRGRLPVHWRESLVGAIRRTWGSP